MGMRAQFVIPVLASISILVLSLVIADMPNTYAHELIDQNALQVSYVGGGAIDIAKGGPDTGQTFRPQSLNIVAVDIDVSDSKTSGTSSPVDVTVRILNGGTLASPELGSVTKSVTHGGTFAAPQTEHFDFGTPIPVIPGKTYTITVESANSPEDLKWLCAGGNPYADGENISSGVGSTCDQGFATYSGEPVEDACNDISDIINAISDIPLVDKLEDSLSSCQVALNEFKKAPPDFQAAAGNFEGAVGDLEVAIEDNGLDKTQGEQIINQLLDILRQMADDAINDAIERGADVTTAEDKFSEGEIARAAGEFKTAAAKYKDALATAEGA